jgi:uncharacterized Zn finger protein
VKLSTFESKISKKILQRGLDYYQSGFVAGLIEVAESRWIAEVEGTYDYRVEVELAKDGTILDSLCDCPYDYTHYCKHLVAVFYELKKTINLPPEKQLNTNTLQELLQQKTKDELIEIIVKATDNSPSLAQKLMCDLAPDEDDFINAKKMIHSSIQKASSQDFIEWNRTGDALEGAYLILEKIEKKIQSNQYENALQLCLIVLAEAIELIDYADDSSGMVGEVISTSIEYIEKAVNEGFDSWSQNEKEQIFMKLLHEASSDAFDDWSEWRFQLLTICIPFCNNIKFRQKLDAYLEFIYKEISDDNWSINYDNQRIKELQFHLILQYDTETQLEQFLQQNLDNSNIREKAILRFLDKKESLKALELCKDGIKMNAKLLGLVKKWKNYKYLAYEQLGDTVSLKKLAFELLVDGDYSYYEKLKALHPPNEWSSELARVLREFEAKPYTFNTYTSILVEENEKERLLRYCQTHIEEIDYFFPYLIKEYSTEVKEIFINLIYKMMETASGRKQYQKVCEIIKLFKKAFGKERSTDLVIELKKTNPRRRALLEELDQIF